MNSSDLKDSLSQFQLSLQSHPRVEKLIEGWERDIILESIEDEPGKDEYFLIQVRNEKVSLQAGNKEAWEEWQGQMSRPQIQLRAEKDVFISIFSGEQAPAECYFDGSLQCYASEEDQTKLDAITMVLWGI